MVDFRFYLITDRKRCVPKSLQAVVREACDAGVRAVQLREKDLSPRELEDYTDRLSSITRERGAKLLINRTGSVTESEDVFIAASMSVDGYHFGETASFPSELRRRFPKLIVGISTHSRSRAVSAAAEGADFVTFGPVFETPSKSQYGPPQGLDELSKVTSAAGIPVFAIGGVTPKNTADCLAAGAHGVAVIGAIMSAPDIAQSVKEFEAALGSL